MHECVATGLLHVRPGKLETLGMPWLWRGCISDSIFIWNNNSCSFFGHSFQSRKWFRTGFLMPVRFCCWSHPAMSFFSSCFPPHLVLFSALKVILSRVTVPCQKVASLWAHRWASLNDFGINQNKAQAKQTQMSALNLPPFCWTTFAP